MSENTIISCGNIHKTYLLGTEGVPALRGVDVDVRKGELLVIYGRSGGGKSTLLNILGTIDTPTKGNLFLFGKRVTDRTPDAELAAMRSKRMGFVFQSFNLLSTLSAINNVSLPMMIAGKLSASEIKKKATTLLEAVGLGHRLQHLPSMLSGGEQQRVSITRALANDPEILFLDEPTGDLDTKNTMLVMDILLSLKKERGLTMVMVTHDVYMKQYANRVLYMRDGRAHYIEDIQPCVRNRALEQLASKIKEEKCGKDAPVRATVEIRYPEDYETYSAQRSFDLKEDPEMQDVIEILFAQR